MTAAKRTEEPLEIPDRLLQDAKIVQPGLPIDRHDRRGATPKQGLGLGVIDARQEMWKRLVERGPDLQRLADQLLTPPGIFAVHDLLFMGDDDHLAAVVLDELVDVAHDLVDGRAASLEIVEDEEVGFELAGILDARIVVRSDASEQG